MTKYIHTVETGKVDDDGVPVTVNVATDSPDATFEVDDDDGTVRVFEGGEFVGTFLAPGFES